jgi:hypothetical protein
MDLIPPLEANRRSASHKNVKILQKRNVYHLVQNDPPLDNIQCRFNLISTLIRYSLTIHLINLPSVTSYPEWILPIRVSDENCAYISHLSCK